MEKNFHQVSAALRADHWGKSGVVLVTALLFLAAWAAWARVARIIEYEVSDSARLEIQSTPAVVQADFEGRVATSHMVLGRDVKAGDVLIEADTEAERLAVAEAAAKETALGPQIIALDAQIRSEAAGSGDEGSVLTASRANAAAQVEEAETEWKLAEKDRDRYAQLRREGIASEADAQRVSAQAEAKKAALDAVRQSWTRLAPEQQVRERARQTRIEELSRERAKLQGEQAEAQAERKRLAYETERKVVRAPISGHLAECLPLAPGAHLSDGDKLGVILPSEQVHVVAEFAPAASFGKLRPGQNAVLRLKGFPWAEYGVVRAQVSNVASEIRDGKVRVELAVIGQLRSSVPLQHGLPGSVEVETGRVSPFELLLRTAGDLAGRH